ncbi:nitroreductase [Saccharopolyspora gloriosae]|uniref:Nitroreductase n=1 Tax=Saccharopolyspora gloriosae TaxID=455344 RepID=A0A840NLM0_9PSEU|nr:nitroreductase family protein [Saccharopolyspora gloriosae]MBB5070022.1 nitroreductase [Saccharopolyspora gloriosae]
MAPRHMPTAAEIRSVLVLACRAPSVHNTQPWRWRPADRSLHLYLDPERTLGALDPTGREAVISCGAVLHHARIAFGSEGWRTVVHRLPNPGIPTHLAAIEFGRAKSLDPHVVELAAAADRRRTDRRPFLSAPIPEALVDGLVDAAQAQRGTLGPVTEEVHRHELTLAIEQAGEQERRSARYREELAAWSGRHVPGPDGVPAEALPAQPGRARPERDFGLVSEGELPVPVLDDGAQLAVLSTSGDSYESWLAAGEALSAVLLLAELEGLATCPLSQLAEVGTTRSYVRDEVLGGAGYPQLALRVGWPVREKLPGPPTPRRSSAECVAPLGRFR